MRFSNEQCNQIFQNYTKLFSSWFRYLVFRLIFYVILRLCVRENIISKPNFINWGLFYFFIFFYEFIRFEVTWIRISCFSFGLWISVSVRVWVCYECNSKANNSRKYKFRVFYWYFMEVLHKFYCENRMHGLCTRAKKAILKCFGKWKEFFISAF